MASVLFVTCSGDDFEMAGHLAMGDDWIWCGFYLFCLLISCGSHFLYPMSCLIMQSFTSCEYDLPSYNHSHRCSRPFSLRAFQSMPSLLNGESFISLRRWEESFSAIKREMTETGKTTWSSSCNLPKYVAFHVWSPVQLERLQNQTAFWV